MVSIHTNISAIAALGTLRTLASDLETEQRKVSTGMRVGIAADNAAYWSISTTMRSDNMALSAVSDALGLGAAKVDVAYAGLTSVIDVLSEFKARLVAAEETGVDKAKVQAELDQLKEQVQSIASSASFGGVNWLNTGIDDIFDKTQNRASVVSSFIRDAAGGVSVKTMELNLSKISLFNSTGGGLLQADPRDLGTIGGLRFPITSSDSMSTYSAGNTSGSAPSNIDFTFTGPLSFGVGDEISFDITIDADNPTDPIDPPYFPGQTARIVIDRATVDAVLPSANGVISTYKEYSAVLSHALAGSGATTTTYWKYDPPNQTDIKVEVPDVIGVVYLGNSSLNGSSIEVSGFTHTVGSGGFGNVATKYGVRSSEMSLAFERFTVFEDVVVSFSLRVDRESAIYYSFDKAYVNSILGIEDGKVSTSDDMATLLNSLIDRPDVIIEPNGSTVSVKTDPSIDRKSGSKSGIGFWGINVNIEPIPKMNFLDIDIEQNPNDVSSYISYIETVTGRITDAASILGSVGKRIDMQSNFASRLMDSISSGIGRLIDADMDEAATRMKALEARKELALETLHIANAQARNIAILFQ